MSPEPDAFAAELLQRGSRSYAGFAAQTLLESRPDIAGRFGPDALGAWQSDLVLRVQELAAAVSTGEPRLFESRVRWAARAFKARERDPADLAASLEALHSVLAEQLPEPARPRPLACLRRAIDALAAGEGADKEDDGLDPAREQDRLALRFLHAVLTGDVQEALAGLLRAVDEGLPVADAYLGVLLPAEREIGRLWHLARVRVAEEHLVTFAIQRAMALLAHRAPAAPANGRTVVVAAVASNAHDIALRAGADLFQLAGWRSIFLGADVPVDDLVAMLDIFEADALLLGATLVQQVMPVRQTIRSIREHCGRPVKIIVGGAAFDDGTDLWKTIGADGYAAELASARTLAAKLTGLA